MKRCALGRGARINEEVYRQKGVQKDLVAGEIQLVSMVICLIMAVWLLYLYLLCKSFLNHLCVTSCTCTCAAGTKCQLLVNWFVS